MYSIILSGAREISSRVYHGGKVPQNTIALTPLQYVQMIQNGLEKHEHMLKYGSDAMCLSTEQDGAKMTMIVYRDSTIPSSAVILDRVCAMTRKLQFPSEIGMAFPIAPEMFWDISMGLKERAKQKLGRKVSLFSNLKFGNDIFDASSRFISPNLSKALTFRVPITTTTKNSRIETMYLIGLDTSYLIQGDNDSLLVDRDIVPDPVIMCVDANAISWVGDRSVEKEDDYAMDQRCIATFG